MNKVNIMHRTMIKQAVHKRIDNFYVRYDLFDSNGQNITADDESNNGVKFINLKVGEYILHAQELCKDNESGEKFIPIGDVSTKTIFIKFSEK